MRNPANGHDLGVALAAFDDGSRDSIARALWTGALDPALIPPPDHSRGG